MRHFKAANRAMKEKCIEGESDREHDDFKAANAQFKPGADDILGYKIKEENLEECQYFAITEPRFVFQLRDRQFPYGH